jgi:hypothetical protein
VGDDRTHDGLKNKPKKATGVQVLREKKFGIDVPGPAQAAWSQ